MPKTEQTARRGGTLMFTERSSSRGYRTTPTGGTTEDRVASSLSKEQLEQQLASTRKNLASNVTLLEEANRALSRQTDEISELKKKLAERSKEKAVIEGELRMTKAISQVFESSGIRYKRQFEESEKRRKAVEKELEELRRKKFKFSFECGIEDAEAQ